MTNRVLGLGLLTAALLTSACGDNSNPTTDAGPTGNDGGGTEVDGGGGGTDGGPTTGLGTCDAPRTVALTVGETTTVTGDTTDGPDGALALGDTCGDSSSSTNPAQDVIAVQIPGSGQVGLNIDTSASEETFDIVVQVRTSCETAPTAFETCIDNTATDIRGVGGLMVEGGSTVYLVVTGYPESDYGTDTGVYSIDLSIDSNAAPTLTGATAQRVDASTLVLSVDGGDVDSNAMGISFALLDDAGSPVTILSGYDAYGPFELEFDAAHATATFTGATASFGYGGTYDGPDVATQVQVSVYDYFHMTSSTMTVAITDVTSVGFGEACDATHVCAAGYACTGGTCAADATTTAACDGATAVTLTAPTGSTAASTTVPVTFAAGAGSFVGSCAGAGAESLLRITIPEGAYDLVASTATSPDTVDSAIYLRSNCVDGATEAVCNDDIDTDAGDYRSTATIQNATGSYTVFVDQYAAIDAALEGEIVFTLVPVLAGGAACDSTGVANRCATGTCPTTGEAVCPSAS